MRLYVAKEPVGIQSRVEKITQLLILGNNDVRVIGIYGMGGVGKTTIAKAVYNKIYVNFEGSCFLMNAHEVSGYPNDLVGLQKELLYEVLKIKDIPVSTVDRGISLIEERLRHKKVLIVLDDLYHVRQLDSLAGQWNRFAPGSRIIVTTRVGRLLDQIQVDDRYQAGQMNKDEALELLSRHAFGKSIPDEDFMELSKDVLRCAGGVPLALEVFGSNLVNRTMIEWRSFIKKLQQSPHHEIQEKLIISFDALKDDNLQDIFLDIACFFIGVDKNEAISILNACDFCPENDIAILEKRCLLTIDGNNKLRMHDLLQDMGRGIVRKKSKIEGGMLSRLWSSGDISDVMKSTKGASSIEGIIPKDFNSWTRTLSTHTFERMNKLRLLQINYVHLSGSFEHIFQDLRWLCWNECPLKCLPCDFHPEKLVILDMQHSKVTTLWEHWEGIKFLQNLKTLNLSYSLFLTTTPDFTRVPMLERLLLQNCESLTSVHPSIGRLSRLVYLNLKNCHKLQNFLPNDVCHMRSLEELNLCCCYKLEHLPEQLGNMARLRRLFASETAISKIPDSIGNLSRLGELDLNHCNNLINLPNNMCGLRALETLNLHCCSNLEGLPEELGNMECLRVLDISFTSLKKLPYSIGLLKSLHSLECSLKVFDTQITFVPPSISGLCSLKELDLDFCSLLKIPDGIGCLSSLEMLSLSHNHFQSLPSGFSQLVNLNTLNLRYCKKLASLSELPPNLEWFYASGCTEMKKLASVSKLKDLKYLDLRNCRRLVEIPGLEDLNFVQYVHLEGCISLRTFKESFFKRNSEFGEIIIVLPQGRVSPLSEGSSICFYIEQEYARGMRIKRKRMLFIPSESGKKSEIRLKNKERGEESTRNLEQNKSSENFWDDCDIGENPPYRNRSGPICFCVPNKLEDILGMAIWGDCDGEYPRQITVAIKNTTKNSEWTHQLSPPALKEFSFLIFIPKTFTIESGDTIMVSFPFNVNASAYRSFPFNAAANEQELQSVGSCGGRLVYKSTEARITG